ncbi:hypothetical protein [Methanobrevibacter sp. DSM 116169]|uniref:hypothetical protein n=1 Tax=Methanobrevibacter sp. DSM 116169 TaxID=3242727 RepID=UPI0038FD3DCC
MNLKKTISLILILTVILIISLYGFYGIVNDESNLKSNELGSVDVIGPIGNTSSNVKIAYIVGVHPLESVVHDELVETLKSKSDSLNYCYYIYKINVTDNPQDYEIGRMNGQLLANEYVVSDIINKDYNLVVDIHSNQGLNGGSYEKTNFVFSPSLNDSKSVEINDEILNSSPHLDYYFPESQTSPQYVTLPIIESGTPAIIYETYMYESRDITHDYINKLIIAIDSLKKI